MPPIITSAPPPYYDFPPAYSANPTDIVDEAPPRYTARRDRTRRIHRDQPPSITERHLTAIGMLGLFHFIERFVTLKLWASNLYSARTLTLYIN